MENLELNNFINTFLETFKDFLKDTDTTKKNNEFLVDISENDLKLDPNLTHLNKELSKLGYKLLKNENHNNLWNISKL